MNANINNNVNNNKINNIVIGNLGHGLVKGEGIMRNVKNIFSLRNTLLATAAAATGLIAAPRHAEAALYTLTSGNSVVNLNPFHDNSQLDGLYNWTVDGITQLHQQGFWYRVGGTGAAANVATLSPSVLTTPIQLLDTTGQGGSPNFASVSYSGTGFTVNTRYQLTGGQPGSEFSNLTETVVITNTSSKSIAMSAIDYTDLDLGGSSTNETASAISTGVQILQTSGDGKWTDSQIAQPNPSSFEVAAVPTILNGLNGSGIPLNDNLAVAGVDASNGVEYDKSLNAGQSLIFTVNEVIQGPGTVPEPTSSAALLAASSLFLTRPRRRDNDADPRTAAVAGA